MTERTLGTQSSLLSLLSLSSLFLFFPLSPVFSPFYGRDGFGNAHAHFLDSGIEFFRRSRSIEPRKDCLLPFRATCGGTRHVHPLAYSAMLLEVLLLRSNHLVEKILRLLDDDNHQVTQRICRARIEERFPVIPVRVFLREIASCCLFFACGFPFRHAMRLQPVKVIFE